MISNKSEDRLEHFCTLFDSKFLPMGMSLHSSLMQQAQPFHLWILCMDEIVEQQLKELALPNVTLIPLHEVETAALLSVKPGRSRAEYCWTLTPFTFQAVFARDEQVKRVTYLDADLFFFDNPRILLNELDGSEKEVLITDHAYAPEYDAMVTSGRFCVQFLTFNNTPQAQEVMHWWQDRCLEWCFARLEDDKFGDQKYLDKWPELFPDRIHIVKQFDKTLAPWNVRFMARKFSGELKPVFYHFHGLRIISPKTVRLYFRYRVGKLGLKLYENYTLDLLKSLAIIKSCNIEVPFIPLEKGNFSSLRHFKRLIFREIQFAKIA